MSLAFSPPFLKFTAAPNCNIPNSPNVSTTSRGPAAAHTSFSLAMDAAASQLCFQSSDCCWFLGWHWHLVGLGTLESSHQTPDYSHQWEEICMTVIKHGRQSWDTSSQATHFVVFHLHICTQTQMQDFLSFIGLGDRGFNQNTSVGRDTGCLGLSAVTQSSKMVTKLSYLLKVESLDFPQSLRKWFFRVCTWEVSMRSPLE